MCPACAYETVAQITLAVIFQSQSIAGFSSAITNQPLLVG
jgi:hypothetical protein